MLVIKQENIWASVQFVLLIPVIESALLFDLNTDNKVLIEATSNQVNQFGGYTGMKPADFRDFIYGIAQEVGFPRERLILGGDHLGPNCWQNEPAAAAMEKSVELIKAYVAAGFSKIHRRVDVLR